MNNNCLDFISKDEKKPNTFWLFLHKKTFWTQQKWEFLLVFTIDSLRTTGNKLIFIPNTSKAKRQVTPQRAVKIIRCDSKMPSEKKKKWNTQPNMYKMDPHHCYTML